MPTIKYTREDIDKLVNELDQYRTAHDKLTAGLKEAVAESIKYKRERDSLLKDIEFLHQLRKGDCSALDTLKAGNNHLIYERDELNEKLNKECNDNYKLEGQLHDMTKQRDELIKDVEKQRELLKDFSRFIHRKVEACPGKPEYINFRHRLDELGIGERE